MCQSYKTVLFIPRWIFNGQTQIAPHMASVFTIQNDRHTQCFPSLSSLAHNRAIIFIKVVKEMRCAHIGRWMRWNAQRTICTAPKRTKTKKLSTNTRNRNSLTHTHTHQKEFSHQFLLEAIKIDENSCSIVQFHSIHRSKFMVISALGRKKIISVFRSKQFSLRPFNFERLERKFDWILWQPAQASCGHHAISLRVHPLIVK